MKSYAVIFSYSFDDDVAVYLFDTWDEALKFLKDSYNEEMRIDIEENGWDTNGSIEEDTGYAKIFNRFYDHTNVTEMKIGHVYR